MRRSSGGGGMGTIRSSVTDGGRYKEDEYEEKENDVPMNPPKTRGRSKSVQFTFSTISLV